MTMAKPARKSVSKLQKAHTAKGDEYYYSKRPLARKSDFTSQAKAKPPVAKARPITVKKK